MHLVGRTAEKSLRTVTGTTVRIPTPPPLVLIAAVIFASLPSKENTCSSFSWVACTTMVLPSLLHTEPCAQVPIFGVRHRA